jgi:hypothetical protein
LAMFRATVSTGVVVGGLVRSVVRSCGLRAFASIGGPRRILAHRLQTGSRRAAGDSSKRTAAGSSPAFDCRQRVLVGQSPGGVRHGCGTKVFLVPRYVLERVSGHCHSRMMSLLSVATLADT